MTRLNLLPWREQRRKERDRALLRNGSVVWVIAAALIFAWHMGVTNALHNQEQRNAFLRQAIGRMKVEVAQIMKIRKTRSAAIARMHVIQKLQGNRMQIVHTFDSLVRAVPSGVYLKMLKQKGQVFTISGVAQSNERVSQLMRNFAGSPWFQKPVLTVINVVPAGNGHLSLFTLTVQGKLPGVKAKKTTGKRVVMRR